MGILPSKPITAQEAKPTASEPSVPRQAVLPVSLQDSGTGSIGRLHDSPTAVAQLVAGTQFPNLAYQFGDWIKVQRNGNVVGKVINMDLDYFNQARCVYFSPTHEEVQYWPAIEAVLAQEKDVEKYESDPQFHIQFNARVVSEKMPDSKKSIFYKKSPCGKKPLCGEDLKLDALLTMITTDVKQLEEYKNRHSSSPQRISNFSQRSSCDGVTLEGFIYCGRFPYGLAVRSGTIGVMTFEKKTAPRAVHVDIFGFGSVDVEIHYEDGKASETSSANGHQSFLVKGPNNARIHQMRIKNTTKESCLVETFTLYS